MNTKIRILLICLVVAVIIIGGCYYKFVQAPKMNIATNEVDEIEFDTSELREVKHLPKNMNNLIDKLDLFPDIYKSNKKVLIYGYIKGQDDETEYFHRKIQKTISKSTRNEYKIIAVGNVNKFLEKTLRQARLEKTKNIPESDIKEISKSYDIIIDCLSNCCIIDPETKDIIKMNKNPYLVIKELEHSK